MRNKFFFLSLFLGLILFSTFFTGCKKEDDPTPLTLVSLVAGTIDLNGATAATTVPVEPVIVATFSTNIDATTATAANIKLERIFDAADVPLTLTVSGKTITITPNEELYGGANYELSVSAALKSTDGLAIPALTRAFTTLGSFVPSGQIAYWNFEDNANDQVGAYDPLPADIIDITYTASRKTAAGKAATFNGSTSIIEVPNGDDLMNTNNFSWSFWVKTNSTDKTNGHWVMGCAGFSGMQFEIFGSYDGAKFAITYKLADGTGAAEDMWFPALADLGWQGWNFAKSLTVEQMQALLKDSWLHVVYTYNATTKEGTLYYNGEKMKSFDFDLWPDGDAKRGVTGLKYNGSELGTNLAFGFFQGRNNMTHTWADYADLSAPHFKGQLDDIRIFHKTLTGQEVLLMYNSEK
jgi:hypothetical protein